MNDHPSILTRRGFLRTMGLIVGAAAVVPAALVARKQYHPSEVEVYVCGKRCVPIDSDQIPFTVIEGEGSSVDFSDGESYTIITEWDASDSDPIGDIEAMIRLTKSEVYQRAPGENDDTFRKRIKRDLQ